MIRAIWRRVYSRAHCNTTDSLFACSKQAILEVELVHSSQVTPSISPRTSSILDRTSYVIRLSFPCQGIQQCQCRHEPFAVCKLLGHTVYLNVNDNVNREPKLPSIFFNSEKATSSNARTSCLPLIINTVGRSVRDAEVKTCPPHRNSIFQNAKLASPSGISAKASPKPGALGGTPIQRACSQSVVSVAAAPRT